MENGLDKHTLQLVSIGCAVLLIVGRVMSARYYASGGDGGQSNAAGFSVSFVLIVLAAIGIICFFVSGGQFNGISPLKYH